MNTILKLILGFFLLLSSVAFSQTVRVIDNKGTVKDIDNSKWDASGTTIYNKNTGNIGIGTTTPDASAKLDISSTSGGLLPPRMTTAQRDAIASPANGLVIFNTTSNTLEVNTGTTSVPSWNSSATPDATTIANGIVRLAGDLSGTAAAPQIAADAVTTAEILDATVDNADLDNGVGGIYKGSGSLAANTTVTGGANTLAFTSIITNGFSVDGTTLSVDASNHNIGIGTTSPDASAILEANSTTKGFLPPRMATTERNAISLPAKGLTIYNTSTNAFEINIGTSASPNWFAISQATLDLKLDVADVGVANGAASLDSTGKIPTAQIPTISFSSATVVGSEAAMLALTGQVVGNLAIRSDNSKNYVLSGDDPSVLSNWIELLTPAAAVSSVGGLTGAITLAQLDLDNVDNTTDLLKPISTDTQTALDLKADIASPALTGIPTAPTAAVGTNTTQIATTAFVMEATADATTTTNGIVRLAGDLAGTATSPQIATDAVTTTEILDATVANDDLDDGVGGIYKGNGSLSGNTTVTGGASTLAFTSTASNGFSVDGTTFSVDAANDNIGIGTTTPDTSAALEINTTSKGFLPPRMTTVNRNAITLPASGLIIYNTTTSALETNTGTSAAPVWTSAASGAFLPLAGGTMTGDINGTNLTLNNNGGTNTTTIGGGTTTGAVSIGGTGAQSIDLGTGAAVKTVTVGSSNTTSATTIQGGTGTGAITLTPAPAGTIVVGNTAGTGAITLGSSSTAQTTNVGTGTGNSTVNIANGGGNNTVVMGGASGTSATTIQSGTGALSLTPAATGTIIIGNAGGIGNITLGSSSSGQTTNVGTGSGNSTVNVATGAGANTVVIGGNGTSSTTTVRGGTGTGAITLTPATAGSIVVGATAGTGAITIGSSSVAQTTNVGTGTGISSVNIATGSTTNANLITLGSTNSQVGVGAAPSDASAALAVNTTTKGFLPPRLSATQLTALNLTSPATGLTIFNTTNNSLEVNTGTPAAPVWTSTNTAAFLPLAGGTMTGDIQGTSLNLNNNGGTNTTSIGGGTTTGAVTIGGTGTQSINLGSGAGIKTVTVGSGNSTSATTIQSGTGAMTFTPAATGNIVMGNTAGTGTITLGSSSASQTTNVGTGAGNSTVNVATGAGANTVIIGANGTTSSTTIRGGTGTGAITMTPAVAGTIVMGNAAGTGSITLGSSSAAQTTNIGTGSGDTTMNIATGSGANTITIGSTFNGVGTTNLRSGMDGITITPHIYGPIVIGNSGGNANITLGSSSLAQTTNIGTGAGISTVNIATGSTTNANLITLGSTNSRVGIGTSPSDASAALAVNTTTKGFLPPRLTTTQRGALTSPATGLTIYNTTNSALETNTGTPASPIWSSASASDEDNISLNSIDNATVIGTINLSSSFGMARVVIATKGFGQAVRTYDSVFYRDETNSGNILHTAISGAMGTATPSTNGELYYAINNTTRIATIMFRNTNNATNYDNFAVGKISYAR